MLELDERVQCCKLPLVIVRGVQLTDGFIKYRTSRIFSSSFPFVIICISHSFQLLKFIAIFFFVNRLKIHTCRKERFHFYRHVENENRKNNLLF